MNKTERLGRGKNVFEAPGKRDGGAGLGGDLTRAGEEGSRRTGSLRIFYESGQKRPHPFYQKRKTDSKTDCADGLKSGSGPGKRGGGQEEATGRQKQVETKAATCQQTRETKKTESTPESIAAAVSKPSQDGSTGLKPTRSDYRKLKINEILRDHAQKVPSKSGVEGSRENVAEAVTMALTRASENLGGRNKAEDRKPEDRKAGKKWMKFPQSMELQSRLAGSWNENLFFCDSRESASREESRRGEAKAEEKTGEGEGEKSQEKRSTYTDRLLMLKNVRKGQREAEPEPEPEPETETETEAEKHLATLDFIRPPEEVKQVPLTVAYQLDTGTTFQRDETLALPQSNFLSVLKDVQTVADPMFKPKASRSAELRDLVNQAVKDHKTFCIFDSHWYIVRPVREELLNRGWLEVIPDRRMIPRRRPPPMGPLLDRDKAFIERNCNTIEAILAAKEIFADELEETASRSSSWQLSLDPRPRGSSAAPAPRKPSDDSLRDSASVFRILPPVTGGERRRNSLEIREFVAKCETLRDADGDRETRRPKGAKTGGKKTKEGTGSRGQKVGGEGAAAAEAKPEEEPREEGVKMAYKENEAKLISKMIQSANAKIHFMWLSIKPAIHLKCFNYSPEIINKFQKTTFCTKIGLWNHLNNIQWYAHEVRFPAKSPRMYNTGEADDLQAFFQDFQLTACMGMLKWLSDTFFDRGIKAVQAKKGQVPLKAFEFAIKQCERYMRFRENEDLSVLEEPRVLQEEWNTFLQWFYTITNDQGKLQESSSAQLMIVYTKAVETLRTMKKHWPEIDVDGRLNIWIMKPYCASCGRGIFMTNNVYYIGQHSKYIVQKYIEKPLLIYNTKFDIRQWFMVTKLTPLEIWMYKECYLRFCTQPFVLRNLHESVHLSNNSVQRKYVTRDSLQSDQNMWDSNTFQMYLKTIGHPNAWDEIIYPGMKDAIVSIMLAAQDNFDGPRRSWFEVYGADFMLSANVKDGPWLIEINENPAMDPSTKVTARLCPQMLRDVIKVVVDKKLNKNASTGQWELIYRQNYSPSFGTVDLDVKGRKIARVPTSLKVEYTHKKPERPAYEAVRSLNGSAADASRSPNKSRTETVAADALGRLEPLFPFRKATEYRSANPEVGNANAFIQKVIESHIAGEKTNRQRMKTVKNESRGDLNCGSSHGKGKTGNVSGSSNGHGHGPSGNEPDKFKFVKFYRV